MHKQNKSSSDILNLSSVICTYKPAACYHSYVQNAVSENLIMRKERGRFYSHTFLPNTISDDYTSSLLKNAWDVNTYSRER